MTKILIIAAGVIAGLIVLIWIGLQLRPKPFPAYPGEPSPLETVPLPKGLPEPVARFYRGMHGDQIPVIESAVITGRATMRVFGITFPARFRFTHEAGLNYRHYIEAMVFGFPIMRVNESYLDGESRMETPGGLIEKEPKINQAANLGLWAESIWLPSIFLTDPRVRWEPVDKHTARLRVPFEDTDDIFTVSFDSETGRIAFLEAMRYRDAADVEKILWKTEAVTWGEQEGRPYLQVGAVTWQDQGQPWAVFTVEELTYNVAVLDYVRDRGL